MAWLIAPDFTSSYRTRPGTMGSPAASADVQVSGRSAFDPRSKMAPLPALGSPACQNARYSSNRTHVSTFTMSAWRSELCSMGMSGPNGYGPGSLSSAYRSLMKVVEWESSTTAYGMP